VAGIMLDTVIDIASTEGSDVSSLQSARTRDGPPRTIQIPTLPLERKQAFYLSSPYAQLCYDPQLATLVAVMETGRKARRPVMETPDSFPSFQPTNTASTTSSTTSSSSSSSSNLSFGDSTFSLSTMTEQRFEVEKESSGPFVLGSYIPEYEDDNCLYLLHDCDDVSGNHGDRIGCVRALDRFVKSRPFAFLHHNTTNNKRQPLRERIIPLKHKYEPFESSG
jgi:hypothetical protein